MRIAVIHWVPMNDIGGINSWITNFMMGCERLGYDATLFNVAPQMRYHGARPGEMCEAQTKARFSVLPGIFVPLSQPNLEELRSYDVIVFGHPSFHPTKAFLDIDYIENWKLFYDLPQRKVVIFHDKHWDRTNPWFSDVADKFGDNDLLVAAQHMFYEPVQEYPANCPKTWSYFPIDAPDTCIEWSKRKQEGCIITQWLALKNHGKLLDCMDEVQDWPRMHLFGNGQTYYKHRWRFRKLNIADVTEGREGFHQFHGFCDYSTTMLALKQMRFSLDLSTQGQTNMSHWEPLCHGTPSVVHEDVLAREDCEIPHGMCVPFDWEYLNDVLWNVVREGPGYNLRDVQDWARNKCLPQFIVESLVK